jgi:hypothetical protein
VKRTPKRGVAAASFNELNRTYRTIKQVNLLEELKAAGISILAPT